MSEALDLAERALAAAGTGEAIATVTRERSLTLPFSRSAPAPATSVENLVVEVSALRDGHVGRARGNGTDAEALERCVRAAVRHAEAAARIAGAGHYPAFPPPAPVRVHYGHDPDTASLDPDQGARALSRAFAVGHETQTTANGVWTAGEVETAIASSSGVLETDRVTNSFMEVVAFEPGGRSGYASQTAVAMSALDTPHVAERAAEKALRGAGDSGSVPAGAYPVVMEPPAVHELLEVLAATAFNGLAHAEMRGALTGRLGSRVASPAVNLSDSPRYSATLPRAFDAEGVPKAPLPLIQDGVAHRVVHDTRSAALAGAESTGHAARAGGDPHGPAPTNLVLIGGGAGHEAELCAPIERGIYVTRLRYINVLRPRQALFTAVTGDGTFLIEDGQITRRLVDMRVTDSALGMLAQVEALGERSVLVSGSEVYGRRFAAGSVCPPVRIGNVGFTGSAAPVASGR